MTDRKKDRPAKRRSLTSATNPTRHAVEAAAALAISHPQQLQEAIRLTAALAQRHANADEVAAFAAVIVAAHVENPDSEADWKKAARAATKRAAAAIARSTLGTEAAIPLDPALFTDDTRAALSHEAPDPAADWTTKPADYTAAALALAPATDAQRAALTEAVDRARKEGAPYRRTLTPRPAQAAALTCADDGSAWRDRVRRAVAACRTVEAAALADPFQDGTARTPQDWTHHGPRTGSPLPPAAAPDAATLAHLREAAQVRAALRDRLRVRLALAHADLRTERDRAALAAAGINLAPGRAPLPTPDPEQVRRLRRAWANAATLANRAAAALAHAETHAARTARRTDATPQGLPTFDALALAALPHRHPIPRKDRPAQVPAWQTPGGTAHPDTGALVTVRNYDTGTPGVDLQHVTVTAPDGAVWLDRWTQHPLTRSEVAALSHTLAAPTATAAADALTTVERRMVNPDQGKPVATPSRRPSRVGNTGPTVATFAAVGMTR